MTTMTLPAPVHRVFDADPGPVRTARGKRPNRQMSDYSGLSAQIKAAGLLRRSYFWYARTAAVLVLSLAGLAAVSVWLGESWWQLLVAVGFAVVVAQFGFLGHDAAHKQIFLSGKNNDRAALILANLFVGMGLDWWQHKHNRHHSAPNKIGVDNDIKTGVLTFTAEGANTRRSELTRWLTRHQGRFFFPLLLFTGLELYVGSLTRLLGRAPVKNRGLELTLLVIRHTIMIGFAFWVMSPGLALAFLTVHLLTFGFYLGMSFAPNHIGRPIVPRDVNLDFLRRQTIMSRNISGGRPMDILLGGLNLQIEHHLFPSMSRPNVRRAQPIVADYCRAMGVDYHETTLPQAYREVVDYISLVGAGGIDVWACPVAASMGR